MCQYSYYYAIFYENIIMLQNCLFRMYYAMWFSYSALQELKPPKEGITSGTFSDQDWSETKRVVPVPDVL